MVEQLHAALAAKQRFLESLQAYSIPQFCDVFGIGRTQVFAEMKAGRLRSYMVGRRRFISAAAANDWQRDREAESASMEA
ncbi:MAG: hypothetical protein WCY32_09625 [Burkholderiaceae bacterium]